MPTLDPRLWRNDWARVRAQAVTVLAILPLAEIGRHVSDRPVGLAIGLAWLGAVIADALWEDVRGETGAYGTRSRTPTSRRRLTPADGGATRQ